MKTITAISYNPPESGRTNTGGRDAFIFSDKLEHWIHGNKVRYNPRIDKKDHKKSGGRKE